MCLYMCKEKGVGKDVIHYKQYKMIEQIIDNYA